MGRLTPALRQARSDPRSCDRVPPVGRAPARTTKLREIIGVARDAGRSCYFRPLFDRPRQWAAQRTPRLTPTVQK
jgi:hypothetical protein